LPKKLTAVALLLVLALLSPAPAPAQATDAAEFAWIMVDVLDHPNADAWDVANQHAAYAYNYSYSRGSYSSSSIYIGQSDNWFSPPKIHGETLGLKAVFSTPPGIIRAGEEIKLSLAFFPMTNTASHFKFSGSASANIDQHNIGPSGITGQAVRFANADGQDSFRISHDNGYPSYRETLIAKAPSGREGQRIAVRTNYSMNVAMGTNYVYEWKPISTKPLIPDFFSAAKSAYTPEQPAGDDREEPHRPYAILADAHGEVNVRPNEGDDDEYVFAEVGMRLYHDDRIRTRLRSAAIIGFADLTSFVIPEDSIVVLDIASEKECKLSLFAGTVWTNLKRMVEDGSMEIEMGQAIAGARGTTFICEEANGTSTVKVIEGTVQFTPRNGAPILVGGGEMVSATNGLASPVKRFSISRELTNWNATVGAMTTAILAEKGISLEDAGDDDEATAEPAVPVGPGTPGSGQTQGQPVVPEPEAAKRSTGLLLVPLVIFIIGAAVV